MKSMTGFGSGTATKDGITLYAVEIKSVNASFSGFIYTSKTNESLKVSFVGWYKIV